MASAARLVTSNPMQNERWHQTLKNQILLENYNLPGDLAAQIEVFGKDHNYRRYHEGINNLTPADVYFGRGWTILLERERIKRQTTKKRPFLAGKQAAQDQQPDAPEPPLSQAMICPKCSDNGQFAAQ